MRFPMPRETKHIRHVDNVWYGKPEYKEGLIVPEINIKYGSLYSKVKTMPSFAGYLVGSLRELRKSVKSIERNPYSGRSELSPEELSDLESYARQLGSSGIRYVRLDERHLFQQSIALFRNAQPIPAIGTNLNLTVLARDAGFGEFGTHGLLITPEFGPSVRIAAVLTDAENLPFNEGDPHRWIREYCDSCGACVRACPAGAIYQAPKVNESGGEKHIDYRKCAGPFTKQYGCSICIKECTFFKTEYEKNHKAYLKKTERGGE